MGTLASTSPMLLSVFNPKNIEQLATLVGTLRGVGDVGKFVTNATSGFIAFGTQVILPIIATTAAIGGLIWFIKQLIDYANRDKIALEEMKKSHEETTKKTKELKQAYDDLNNTLNNLEERKNSLKDLEEGTLE